MYFKFRFGYDLRVRKFFIIVVTFLLLLLTTSNSHAETTSSSSANSRTTGYSAIIVSPLPIVETDPSVKIKFTIPDSEIGKKFYLCQEPSCDETDDELPKDISDSRPQSNSFEVKVCGAGDQSLRTSDCDILDENGHYTNYFHGGNNYFLTLVAEDQKTMLTGVTFYIERYFPEIKLHTKKIGNRPKPGDHLQLDIIQDLTLGGGEDRNNYKIVIVKDNDPNYTYSKCIGLESPGKVSVDFPSDTNPDEKNGLQEGSYTVKVYEQTNEDRPFSDRCGEGFLYYTIHFTVNPQGGLIDKPIKDPEKKDNAQSGEGDVPTPTPPPLPCVEGWGDDAKTQKITIKKNDSEKDKNDKLLAIKYCTKVDTALGSLEVMPLGLISNLLRWFLGIAGSASLIIFLYAGYVLMTSAGNKEKVQGARETITSAIVGLIFIIFSVAILEFIGVDILQIPGLGK